MGTQIARVGGTVTVEIPEELLRKANLSVGDSVEWILISTGALALRTPHSADAAPAADGYEQWKLEEIKAGFAEIESGKSVSGEKVIDWLRSWGTEDELPPPQ